MPFPKQDPQPFTEDNVAALCPMQMGVYGIFNAERKCLYVGQTNDLRNTLLQHLRGQSYITKDLRRNGASYWLAALVRTDQLDAFEMLLDAEYRPQCRSYVPYELTPA